MPRGVPNDRVRAAAKHYRAEVQRWTAEHYPELTGRGARAWSRARGEVSRNPEFQRWYRVLEEERKKERRGGADHGPEGRLAQALVEFGYRSPVAWYDVGESEKFR